MPQLCIQEFGCSFILTTRVTGCWGVVCHAQLFSTYHDILVVFNGHAVRRTVTAHTYLSFVMSSKNISWWEEDHTLHLKWFDCGIWQLIHVLCPSHWSGEPTSSGRFPM